MKIFNCKKLENLIGLGWKLNMWDEKFRAGLGTHDVILGQAKHGTKWWAVPNSCFYARWLDTT